MRVVAVCDGVGASSLIPSFAGLPALVASTGDSPGSLVTITCSGTTSSSILDPEHMEVGELMIVCEDEIAPLGNADAHGTIILDDA